MIAHGRVTARRMSRSLSRSIVTILPYGSIAGPSREGIPLRGGLFRCTAGGDRWEAHIGEPSPWDLRTSSLEPPQQSRQTSGFSRAFSDTALIEAKIVEEKAKNTKQFQRFSD